MNNYKADAVSRRNIRDYVYMLKKKVGMENILYFPVLQFAENMLPVLIPDFQFEVVPEDEMGTKHGETYPGKNLIHIREDIYLPPRKAKAETVSQLLTKLDIYLCTKTVQ